MDLYNESINITVLAASEEGGGSGGPGWYFENKLDSRFHPAAARMCLNVKEEEDPGHLNQ